MNASAIHEAYMNYSSSYNSLNASYFARNSSQSSSFAPGIILGFTKEILDNLAKSEHGKPFASFTGPL
jgi:hypothetical protein